MWGEGGKGGCTLARVKVFCVAAMHCITSCLLFCSTLFPPSFPSYLSPLPPPLFPPPSSLSFSSFFPPSLHSLLPPFSPLPPTLPSICTENLEINWPEGEEDDISDTAKDIVQQLLCFFPDERLGSSIRGGRLSSSLIMRRRECCFKCTIQ